MALNQSGLLFVPRAWQRVKFLHWLKRIHAWTGFWGALLFLTMGVSGFLLNHRDKLKIDVDKPVEVDAMEIAVAPGVITDAKSLGRWAKAALHINVDPRPPRGPGGPGGPGERGGRGGMSERGERGGMDAMRARGGPGGGPGGGGGNGDGGGGADGGGRKRFMGTDLPEAKTLTQSFMLPGQKVTVDYVRGDSHVSAKRESLGFLATIKNLHKGVGLPIAWVLFIDTIAGALVTMSLTGFLLWTRLHGSRLIGGGIVLASFVALAATAAGSF